MIPYILYYFSRCTTSIVFITWLLTSHKRKLCNCQFLFSAVIAFMIGHVSYILRKRLTDKDARFERKLRVYITHLCVDVCVISIGV